MGTPHLSAQALAPAVPPPLQASAAVNLDSLPNVILRNIFMQLDPSSLVAVSQSCKTLRELYCINTKMLWRTMAFAHPEATIKKNLDYLTWLERTLLQADARTTNFVLNTMDLVQFHTEYGPPPRF